MSHYSQLFNAYKRRYSLEYSKKKIQDDVNAVWKGLKEQKDNFPQNVILKIQEIDKSRKLKEAAVTSFFFSKVGSSEKCKII